MQPMILVQVFKTLTDFGHLLLDFRYLSWGHRMPDKRYTLRKDEEGTWSVVDMITDMPTQVRERILICMNQQEAHDAAALLNMIEAMRHDAAKSHTVIGNPSAGSSLSAL